MNLCTGWTICVPKSPHAFDQNLLLEFWLKRHNVIIGIMDTLEEAERAKVWLQERTGLTLETKLIPAYTNAQNAYTGSNKSQL